jgi:hypothetical protein
MVKGRSSLDDESYQFTQNNSDSEWLPSEDEPDHIVVPSSTHVRQHINNTTPPQRRRHHHHGLNIKPYDSTICDTYTQGGAFMFYFSNDGTINQIKPRQRFMCSLYGSPLFIKSSCVSSLPRDCCGSLVFYKVKGTNKWNFAILSAVRYLQGEDESNYAYAYKWISSVCKEGVPKILTAINWEVMRPLVEDVCLNLEDVVMYFVNQVSCHLFFVLF